MLFSVRLFSNRLALVASLAGAVVSVPSAFAEGADLFSISGIPENFQTVTEGIFRGGQPDQEGLEYLQKMGVKTIVNINNDDEEVAQWEAEAAAKLGISTVYEPISAWSRPKTKQVDRILAALADVTKAPVYIHCQHGRDRTGMIVGLHRVESQGWTAEDAYDEMIDLGFRPLLLSLSMYFSDRTGMSLSDLID